VTAVVRDEGIAGLERSSVSRWRRVTQVAPSTWAWIALAILLAAAGARFYHLTRGTTFFFDEWSWVIGRRGDDLATFLRTYNGHFSLIPIVIYRLLFITVGLAHYGPYRAAVIATHLLCVLLVFVYAQRRVGSYLALCAAALILFLGAAWDDILWPFQLAWLLSLATGVGALLMLDRRDRLGDAIASVLLAVSLASSGIGIVVALGLVVEVVWGRRRMRDTWIVAGPLALYGLWWLGYQHTGPTGRISLVPHFIANLSAATVGGLAGRAANAVSGQAGTLLAWGRPLLLLAIAVLIWRLIRLRHVPVRGLTLLTMLVSFWILTALTRALPALGLSQAVASRYLYVGGLLVVLLTVELARGAPIAWAGKLVVGAAVVAAVVSGLNHFNSAAAYLRTAGAETRADLGALEIARPLVKPDYLLRHLPGSPLVAVQAGPVLAAMKTLGSPAATPSEIATGPPLARRVADQELIGIHEITLQPAPGRVRLGTRLVLGGGAAAAPATRGGCMTLRQEVGARAQLGEPQVKVPAGGLLLVARGGPATVAVRRFGEVFEPVGTVSPSTRATLEITRDLASQPWWMSVVPHARVAVCALQ
jgi:hypothetical protein